MSNGGRGLSLQVVVDPVVPDQVIGPEPGEHLGEGAPVHVAAGAGGEHRRLRGPLVHQRDCRARLRHVQQRHAQAQAGDLIELPGRAQVRADHRGQDAAGAQADDVDLGGLGDLARRAHRLQHGIAVGVQIPVPGSPAGIAPGDHEYLISLRDEEFEHAAAGREVGDVVLVDHRRDHEQRELVHGGRGRLVLDELADVGAGHHRSRRHREVLADLERVGCHHRRDVRGGGHIGDEGTGTPDDAQAARVDERLPRGRADQQVVARRGRGDEIGQHELQARVVPPVQLGVSQQAPRRSARRPDRSEGCA